MAAPNFYQLPTWARNDNDVSTRCDHDDAFRLRVLGTPQWDAERMIRAARAWCARTGAKPLPRPEDAPRMRFCRSCGVRQPIEQFEMTSRSMRAQNCRACHRLRTQRRTAKEAPAGLDLLERAGLQVDEIRLLDGVPWRVASATYHGGHWGMAGLRVAMVRVHGTGLRQMTPADVLAAPRAEQGGER